MVVWDFFHREWEESSHHKLPQKDQSWKPFFTKGWLLHCHCLHHHLLGRFATSWTKRDRLRGRCWIWICHNTSPFISRPLVVIVSSDATCLLDWSAAIWKAHNWLVVVLKWSLFSPSYLGKIPILTKKPPFWPRIFPFKMSTSRRDTNVWFDGVEWSLAYTVCFCNLQPIRLSIALEQWQKRAPWLSSVKKRGMKSYPVMWEIITNHYKDPYWTTRIQWKVRPLAPPSGPKLDRRVFFWRPPYGVLYIWVKYCDIRHPTQPQGSFIVDFSPEKERWHDITFFELGGKSNLMF